MHAASTTRKVWCTTPVYGLIAVDIQVSCTTLQCMASFKKTPNGATQLCVRNKLLPKPLYATFDTEEQAHAYAAQLEALLAQGIVPAALLERTTPSREIWTVSRCIAEYVRANAVPVSEIKLLDTLRPKLATLGTGYLNYD